MEITNIIIYKLKRVQGLYKHDKYISTSAILRIKN